MSTAFAVLSSVSFIANDWPNVSAALISFVFNLGMYLFLFAVLHFQFVRVNDEGIRWRKWLFVHRVRWDEIDWIEADWSVHFQGLASSYGASSFVGLLKFYGHNGKRLNKLKINCGPVEVRQEIQEVVAQKLRGKIEDAKFGSWEEALWT